MTALELENMFSSLPEDRWIQIAERKYDHGTAYFYWLFTIFEGNAVEKARKQGIITTAHKKVGDDFVLVAHKIPHNLRAKFMSV